MNRNDIIAKAAQAMVAAHDPAHAPVDNAWHVRATSMYAARFRTGLDAVEDDIRRDERQQIIAWLRDVTSNGTPVDPAVTARTLADMLDARHRRIEL